MDSTRSLVRAAAVCVAVLSVAVGVGGWTLADSGNRATALLSPTTFETLDDTLAVTLETTVTVREAMVDLDRLAEAVSASSATTAAFVGETADITTDRVAVSLAAIERSMPSLVQAAEVIDDTLGALALFGVDYRPPIPFDDAVRDIETNLQGLSADVAAQGATLATLVPEIERIETTTASLGGHIVETQARLREAESVIRESRGLLDIAAPVPTVGMGVIRFGAAAFAVVGLTLALLLWRIAGTMFMPTPEGVGAIQRIKEYDQ